MIDVVTKSGKKIMSLTDEAGQEDILYVNGKKINLNDIYTSDEIKQQFNSQVKELRDGKSSK